MPAWFTAVFPVVTLLLGAGAAFAREAFMQLRQDHREALARQHERQTAAVDRREEFELQHLVEVHGLLRAAEEAVWAMARAGRAWCDTDGHDEADQAFRAAVEEYRAAAAAVAAKAGFVLRDEARAAVEKAHEALEEAAGGMSSEFDERPLDSDSLKEQLGTAYVALTSRVRAVYAGHEQDSPPELPR